MRKKKWFARAAAVLLAFALAVPSAAEALPEACEQEKVTVLLLSRDAMPLGMQAAQAGMAADDYALSDAGAAMQAELAARLDALAVLAEASAHCFTETARWSVALCGIAAEVDEGDIPYLRAAGDLAEAGAQFDLYLPTRYAALEDEAGDQPIGTAPELVIDITEQAIPAPGAGTVVAILDSGFDVDEAWLTLPETAKPTLSGGALEARLALIGREIPDAGQDGAKVPFLANYVGEGKLIGENALHGTRVAALVGAHRGDEYDGTAPGAQLALMKVFGDDLSDGASEIAVLSALDDALLLGADVINLSFGEGRGDSAGLSRAISTAQAVGIGVVAAAGNSGEAGAGSFFQSRSGKPYYPTAHPDRGTVIAPASLPGVLAVGAATGSYTTSTLLLDEAGNRILYTDTCDEYSIAGGESGRSFADLLGDAPFHYVAVPGVGRAADYAGLNLVGRVALVARGEISFAEKTAHAEAAGAIGVIVYDNDPETDGAVNMQLDDARLPAVLINIESGGRLAEAGSGILHFPDRDPSTRGMRARAIAEASSRGWGDDFSLAPDLVALGDNFVGLSVDGSIALLEGSSYAAPQVAGALAALIGENRDAADPLEVATARLMNGAKPIADAEVAHAPVTARAQGAGVVDLAAASASPVILRGNAGGAITQTGVDERFTLTLTLENTAEDPQTVVLTPTLFADAYVDALAEDTEAMRNEAAETWLTLCGYSRDEVNYCVTGHLAALDAAITLNGASVRETGASLALAPGERKTVTLAVALDPEVYAAYTAAFPNGFALEGHITAKVGEATLSLPWAAFCGDWSAAPIASATAYTDAPQLFVGQGLTATMVSGYTISLGQMQGGDAIAAMLRYSPALTSINPRGLAEPLALNLFLLRSVASHTVSVTNEAGEVVYTRAGGAFRSGFAIKDIAISTRIPLWDGSVTDNPKLICPDGRYTITLTLYGQAGGVQVIPLDIELDTEAPDLLEAKMRLVNGNLALDLRFRDNAYIRHVEISDRRGTVEFNRSSLESPVTLGEGRGAVRMLTADVTGMFQKYIYVTLTDYAYNVTVVRLDRGALFDAATKP